MPDGLGSRLLRFLRVPYAEPPVGDRRFAKPQPFNFSRSDCRLTGEEAADPEKNLLRLSIRTPDLAPADPLPVLALLLDGSSDFNDSLGHEVGDAIGTSVVMATIGSRFGVLGNVPAGQNNGLEDQRLALEFLRDQLHRFGGDPARVTLAGHGAAAAAVGLHAVGSGGFSRVVMMSGSIAAPLGWSASAEVAAALDRQLAASLSCGIGDEGRLPLDCLRSKPLKDLLDAESLLRRDYGDGAGRFAPSFNASSLPDALWRSGAFNGSLMIGVGTGVGPALAELALRVQGADWGALDQTAFETILDREFGQFPRLHSAGRNASVSGRRYLRLTLSDWPHFAYGGRVRQILARALSDFGAVCPVWEAANDMIGSGRVFVYLHDEDGDPAAALSVANDAKVLLGEPLVRANYSAEHRSLSRIMMQHLVDFTASGAPSPGWPSSSAGAFDFLRFGAKTGVNSTSGGFAFEPGRCPLWSTEMSLASNLSASPPPPQPPPPPPPPPPRTSPGGAQPFSNTVLRNYSVNILGLGRTVGQTIRTPAGKPGPLATSEDCLYLNLWTPKHSDREVEKLPVLVFLHGGFFQTGDAFDERWRGSHVLDQVDAVVVTVAYRLGALGFLWLQNASVPANLGLRDQALALQWVRYNVRFFDGSPSKISLVGAEAGAASVGFHLLAESLQFQRAVLLSGSPNSPFAVSPMPDEVRAMHKNFTVGPAELLDCLRNLTSSEIVSAAADFQRDVARLQAPFVAFGPALDADFLKSDPWSVDALPPVPLLLGGVDSPGNTLVRLLLPDGLNVTRNRVLEHLGQSLRHFPRFGESLSSVGLEAASRRFAEFPSSTADAGVGDVKEAQLLSRALGDRHFTCPSWNFMARAAALSTAQVFGFLLAEPAEEIGDRLVGAS
uniref:COesterase domain-containing protein n=1 Tax=Macrostomum lignano TaxID=282301 RepID=A0A1I8I1T9_9PLAT